MLISKTITSSVKSVRKMIVQSDDDDNVLISDSKSASDNKDAKIIVPRPESLATLGTSAIMGAVRRSIGRRAYRTTTAIRFGSTGSAATLFAPAYALTPNSTGVTEATTFATLFDEARCVGIEAYVSVNGTGALGSGSWAVAFDPGNSGAYASVVGVLVAQQHVGPILYNRPSGDLGPTVINRSGFYPIKIKTLRSSPTAGASPASESVGNDWFLTSDVSANCGYLKFCCDAVTGEAVAAVAFVLYHMEYRSRT